MKHLRVDSGKGQYSVTGDEWNSVDKLDKDALLKLAYLALEDEFEMDEYSEENNKNPAHQIIYKNIYDKLLQLSENKDRFKDESAQRYKKAYEKYVQEVDD